MTAPTIGVAMSLYNQGRFVEESIQSVLDQTLKPDRIVLVDDGSSDGGFETARSYERFGVQVERLNRHGVSSVLNTAFTKLDTEFVALQACDDVSQPERLEWQTDHIVSSGASAVFALPTIVDEATRKMPDSYAAEFFVHNPERDPLRRLFDTGNWMCASSAMINTKRSVPFGPFHPALVQLQDYYLWVNLAKTGRLESLDARLVLYRRPSGGGNLSSTRNDSRMRAEMSFVYRKFFHEIADERFFSAFPHLRPLANNPTLARAIALLNHHDYIPQQVGVELLLSSVEADPGNSELRQASLDLKSFNVDRAIERDQIFERLVERSPWGLMNN